MTRIEPDGYLPRSMVGYADDAAVFLRSTVLRAIDEVVEDYTTKAKNARRTHLIQQWQDRANTLRRLRARFQPTEGENGHE